MFGTYGDLRNSVAKESYQPLVFWASVFPFVKLEGSRSAARQSSNWDRRFSFLGPWPWASFIVSWAQFPQPGWRKDDGGLRGDWAMYCIDKLQILRKSKELEGKEEGNLIIPRGNIIWGLNIKLCQEFTGSQSEKRKHKENSRTFIIRKKESIFFFSSIAPRSEEKIIFLKPGI